MIAIPGAPVSEDEDEDQFHTIQVDDFPKHHDVILDTLQALADDTLTFEGESVRDVMILAPPGSAKSTLVDVVFAPWAQARKKNQNVILASYGADIARKQGRRARQLILSKGHQALFPNAGLRKDNAAADEWTLENGGEYMAGGILTGITGNRADFLLIDDPVKNREQADSETIQKRTIEEYQDSLRTRARPGMRTVLMTTRWNENDLAGSILPEKWDGESGFLKCRDGRVWLVLRIAAQCDSADDPCGREIGEYLWEGYQGAKHFEPFKAVARTWNALFQGKPSGEEGTYFDTGCVQRVAPPPKSQMRIIAASDYATKNAGEGDPDYSCHIVAGIDKDDVLHLLDVWFRQCKTDVWVAQQIAMAQSWRPIQWGEPDDNIRKAAAPFLEREMSRLDAYFHRVQYSVSKDKPTKALTCQARVAKRKLAIAPDAPWANEVLRQMQKFPVVAHDDIVDTLAVLSVVAAEVGPPKNKDGAYDHGAALGVSGGGGGGFWSS